MSRVYSHKDLTNETFGSLTVIKEHHSDNNHRRYWECQCICGEKCIIRGDRLTGVTDISCGCKTKEIQSQKKLKPNGEANVSRIFRQYKRRGLRSGKGFSLSRKEFESLIFSNCHYCGEAPSNCQIVNSEYSSVTIFYNGIDRVDNDLGYHLANCVPCCVKCNVAKSDQTLCQFLEWVKKIFHHTHGSMNIDI